MKYTELSDAVGAILRPNSYSAFPEYKLGWNAAANGATLADNPFAPNDAPLSNHTLWKNGFSDYMLSPYYCGALHLFTTFKRSRTRHNFDNLVLAHAAIPAEEIVEENFRARRYRFADGSAVVVSQRFLYMETSAGEVFGSVAFTPDRETIMADGNGGQAPN